MQTLNARRKCKAKTTASAAEGIMNDHKLTINGHKHTDKK